MNISRFNIEEVASGTPSGLFKTARAPHLADKLGIKAYPALVAVAKDASAAFEIARGMLSFSELEEYIALIPKLYARDQDKREKQ